MKVIVKYKIIDPDNLEYRMYEENGNIIPNPRISDEIVPLGGIASNEHWLKQDVHRCTDEIIQQFPYAGEIEYVLIREFNSVKANSDLEEGYYYLVKIKDFGDSKFRIAKFNGFGQDKGWAGMDWAGDTGSSSDTWMHDQVLSYISIDNLTEIINLGIMTKKTLM